MRTLTYVLRFEGWAETASEDEQRVHVEGVAPPLRIVPHRMGVGVRFEPAEGPSARFRSEVQLAGDGTFHERGTIDLGSGAVLRFESEGEGRIGPAETPGVQRGAVVWRVLEGEGEVRGARGLVTSNFTLGEDGAVVDHQVGVLEIP